MKTCGFCGWSSPKMESPCVHAARGPLTLLSPPHRRTKPVVPDAEGHDSAASVMPWSTRRWPTRQIEPEESDNIRQARDRALADAIHASGAPRIETWGRHNDPVKGLPCGGVILDAQPDTADVWAWKRQNGVAWDDSERKGAIPARRRSRADVGNAMASGDLVDKAKVLHRRWRQHALALDDHAYRAYRRRLRETSWRSLSAPSTPRVGKPKTWKPFDPTIHLTAEGQARYDLERWLDKVLAHHDFEDESSWVDGSKADRHGNDGGWARDVGTRTADTILARKNTLERVEDEVDSRLLHGDDVATVTKFDTERLIELADEAIYATGIPEIVPVIQHLTGGGEDEHLETALARAAKAAGFTTDYTRKMIADGLMAVREVVSPWSRGRSGGWVGVPVAEDPDRVSIRRLFQDAARAEPTTGRKPAADPKAVFWALELADMIACRLSARVVAGLAGATREPVPGWVIAGELYLTAGALVMALQAWVDDTGNPHGAPLPGAPSLPEVIAIVRTVRPGARGLQTATRAVVALAYGVPPEALNAMVKKARA